MPATPFIPSTVLLAVRPDGEWRIGSLDVTSASVERLRKDAAARGYRLVRYPRRALRGTGRVDLALAEDVY